MGRMKPWQILLLALLLVFFLYSIILLVTLSNSLELRRKLNRILEALSLLLSEKARLLLELDALFTSRGVKYSESDRASVEAIKSLKLDKLKPNEVNKALAALKSAGAHLSYLAQSNHWASKDGDYLSLAEGLEANEKSIRQCISAYNLSATGINYWVSIPLVGWIDYLFGIRKRELLS